MVDDRQPTDAAKKQTAINQNLAAFPVGALVELGGRKARVVSVYLPDDYLDYGLVVVEALERLVPAATCFKVTAAGPAYRVPPGWEKKLEEGESGEHSP